MASRHPSRFRSAITHCRSSFAKSVPLASLLGILLVAGAPADSHAVLGPHIWSQNFPPFASAVQIAKEMTIDSQGNLIVVGEFTGTLEFGEGLLVSAGGTDIFMAKFSGHGDLIWSKRFGDGNPDRVNGVAVDGADNIFITGDFQGSIDFGGGVLASAGGDDVYIAKFDDSGAHVWSSRHGDASNESGIDLICNKTGDVIVIGHFVNNINFGGAPLLSTLGSWDVFLVKLNGAGGHIYSFSYGDAANDYGESIDIYPWGQIVIGGNFFGTINFGGGLLTATGAAEDIFLARLDELSAGHQWSVSYGDSAQDLLSDLDLDDGTGDIALTGDFYKMIDFGGGLMASAGGADIFIARLDSASKHIWSNSFGDPNNQTGRQVDFVGPGDIALGSNFQGTVDFGGGPLVSAGNDDVGYAKFDPTGLHLASARYGNVGPDHVEGIVVVPGGPDPYLFGDFELTIDFGWGLLEAAGASDLFLLQMDPGIASQWNDSYGEFSGQYDIVIDNFGDVIMVGEFQGAINFGLGALLSAGGTDIFIVKFNLVGVPLWNASFGDPQNQYADAVDIDSGNNIVMTGRAEGVVNFGGGALVSAGGTDIFLVKFNPVGVHLWSNMYGDPFDEAATSVHVDRFVGSDEIYLTGWFRGTISFGGGVLVSAGAEDMFIANFDWFGLPLWDFRAGDADRQRGKDVHTDLSGNTVVVGDFRGTIDLGGGPLVSAGLSDVFLGKINLPAGTHLWSVRYGGLDSDRAIGLEVNSLDRIIIAGHFHDQIDLGAGLIPAVGQSDIFMAGYLPNGAHIWSQSFGDVRRDRATDLELDLFDRIVMSAKTDGTIDFGGGPLPNAGAQDVYITRFLSFGAHNCSLNYGDRSVQVPTAIHAGGAGDVASAGFFQGAVDFGGGPLFSIGFPHVYAVVWRPGPSTAAGDLPVAEGLAIEASPNPFNPVTRLTYRVPEAGPVSISAYDAAGRLVDRVLESDFHGAGLFELDYTPTMSSGVYFLRIETQKGSSTVKAVLLK